MKATFESPVILIEGDVFAARSAIVERQPGARPTASKKLLRHFGFAETVFRATIEARVKVPGIGAKTTGQIREILSARYQEQ